MYSFQRLSEVDSRAGALHQRKQPDCQPHELYWLQLERRPSLATKPVTQDGLKVMLTGEFENVISIGCGYPAQLLKQGRDISSVVNRPHLNQSIEEAINKRHLVPVSGDKQKAGIAPQTLLGLPQQRSGIVKEDNTLVAVVFIG